jgi:hypothetical protein
MQKSKGQRAYDRLRMLPADELQCPPTARHEHVFVTAVAEIARREAVEEFMDLVGFGWSHQTDRGSVRLFFISAFHGFDEGLLRLGLPGERCSRPQAPAVAIGRRRLSKHRNNGGENRAPALLASLFDTHKPRR